MSDLNTSYIWQGRQDLEYAELGQRIHQVINKDKHHTSAEKIYTLIGFECDKGVAANKGRVGASMGPNAIRDALANIAWHGNSSVTLQDKGNVEATGTLECAQDHFAKQIAECLTSSQLIIGIGGGHEIAWGSYQGLAQHIGSNRGLDRPAKKIGIVNFDAHFDLRNPHPSASSGTPFRQIAEQCIERNQNFDYACIGLSQSANTEALFKYAKQVKVRYLFDINCKVKAAKKLLKPLLTDIDELYVTICLDAFPSAIAPGVSAPSTLGISPHFVIKLIHWLADSQEKYCYNWHLADIAEMNPSFDIDNTTARLAARLTFEVMNAHSKIN